MKVLIYFDKNLLEPIGGPTGYLYNLYSELINEDITEIEFLNSNKSKVKIISKKIYKKLPKTFQKLYKKLKRYVTRYKLLDLLLSNTEKKANIDLNQYDIIHFHSTTSLYLVKDSLKEYKGKVILTSHSPKAQFKEIIEDRTDVKYYLKRKKDFDKLEKIDEYAFDRADYIIFPCEDAEEPYFNTWTNYKNIKARNMQKYRYLPTGILPIDMCDNSYHVRNQYNIPLDAIVISYVGRHNEVKGYNKLKEFAEYILPRNKKIYFLIAGVEEPIFGLKNDRWIEVGWTNFPYDIIKCSDIFILPNKETYFDLILLEVLSIGKPVFLTSTGGNKYFKKFNNSGLIFYNYGNEVILEEEINKLNKDYCIELGKRNKKIFDNNFTISIFCKKYLKLLNEIYEESRKK